ncbi:MAG: VCBS repeat-containing protein [Siphonobacter sp.]
MKYWLLVCLAGLYFLAGCQQSERKRPYVAPDDPLLEKRSAARTGLSFKNTLPTIDSLTLKLPVDSIQTEHFLRLIERLFGAGGVAVGDLSNDGLPDIFFTSADGNNRFFLNRGGWHFEDVTEAAGLKSNGQWSAGITLADVNADGWLDVYICHFGVSPRNELFLHTGIINEQGIPLFSEKAAEIGLENNRQAVQSVFFDYDLDGDLDCYVANYALDSLEWNQRTILFEGGDRLFVNEKGLFKEVKTNLVSTKYTTGIAVADLNGDHWPDLYLSQDAPEADHVYFNQGKGIFREETLEVMSHTPARSLGVVAADLDNDQQIDVFTASVLPEDIVRRRTQTRYTTPRLVAHNTLQHNTGNGFWADEAWLVGVAATDVSQGGLMVDIDSDGQKDLIIPNGQYRDVRDLDFLEGLAKRIKNASGHLSMTQIIKSMPSDPQSDFAFINKGKFRFENQALRMGLGEPNVTNGVAYGDFDNDGDLDLVMNHLGKEAGLYENATDAAGDFNYLKIKLRGPVGNPFGYGTEVIAYTQGITQLITLQPNQGYQSSQEPVMQIGLGKAIKLDSLVVIWPSFKSQTLKAIDSKQTITLSAEEAQATPPVITRQNPAWFKNISERVLKADTPYEALPIRDVIDQPLLPRTLQDQGPKLIQGDVNGDGLPDLYRTASTLQAGQLLIQQPDGGYKVKPGFAIPAFTETAAVFLDVEGDNDLDLLIGAGSSQPSDSCFVRLYLNDGKGNFTLAHERLPALSVNVSCLVAADLDRDGDVDVFVGARSAPGSYGITPKSYILRNQKGVFKEDTPEVLSKTGLITDAVWEDVNHDQWPDLVVIGEWMPVTIFYNRGGKFTYSHTQTIQNSEGWWTTIKAADLDQDGDIDFVLGNIGLNSEYRASIDNPLLLHVNDFDRNGTIDPIMSTIDIDGERYPLASRAEWKQQLKSWPYLLPSNQRFAEIPVNRLLTQDLRRGMLEKKAVEFQTSILKNEGKENFKLMPLPMAAQISSVYSIVVSDFTHDGKPDILLNGNTWGLPPGKGRLDASRGLLVMNSGETTYHMNNFAGQIRDVLVIPKPTNASLVIARRQGRLVFLQEKVK